GVQVAPDRGWGQPQHAGQTARRHRTVLADGSTHAVPGPGLCCAVCHKHHASVTYIHVRTNEGAPNLIPLPLLRPLRVSRLTRRDEGAATSPKVPPLSASTT